MDERQAFRALAFLRIILGGLLVWQVLPNLDQSFIERLPEQLALFAQANPFSLYRWGLHHIAAPNVEQLGIILSVGQFLAGTALFIGFLTRLAAGLGIVYAINLFLALGHLSLFHQSFSILLGLAFITLLIGDAGRYYGLDRFLFKKCPDENRPKKPKFKNKKQQQVVEGLNRQLKKQAGKKGKSKTPVG